ncbi:MAG TPA: SDR family NAD(P)-dependent oxidoreductase, partial [Gammaproteobacteria bacterium]|nr:SDR family NAD(P)-dependent oxidoreductase [Gammaproteobacteria bacterium]
MSDFSDEVVLVTGGTRGIGRGLVKAFARAGAKVALCGRGADAAAEAADAVAKKTSATVIGVQADISSSDDVDRMIAEVGEKLGPIRVLVNNAGITKDGLLLRMKNEQWEEVIG